MYGRRICSGEQTILSRKVFESAIWIAIRLVILSVVSFSYTAYLLGCHSLVSSQALSDLLLLTGYLVCQLFLSHGAPTVPILPLKPSHYFHPTQSYGVSQVAPDSFVSCCSLILPSRWTVVAFFFFAILASTSAMARSVRARIPSLQPYLDPELQNVRYIL